MQIIKFNKYQGLGNDFIIIDDRKDGSVNNLLLNDTSLVRNICNRKYGVGADGIIIARNSEHSLNTKMQIFNSDGSIAEMCGNGIRCLIKYLYQNTKFNDDNKFIIETLAGDLDCSVINGDNIRVNMGHPSFKPSLIPTTLLTNHLNIPEGNVEINNEDIKIYGIGMGNPHMVIILKSIDNIQLEDLGRIFETDKRFPNKTNVHFVEVLNKNKILVKVWERGCGATLACGTGACACLAVTSLLGLTNNNSEVILPGGSLFIDWLNINEPIYMSGPAEFVYSGELKI